MIRPGRPDAVRFSAKASVEAAIESTHRTYLRARVCTEAQHELHHRGGRARSSFFSTISGMASPVRGRRKRKVSHRGDLMGKLADIVFFRPLVAKVAPIARN